MSDGEDDVRSKQLKIVIVGDGSSGKVSPAVAMVSGHSLDTFCRLGACCLLFTCIISVMYFVLFHWFLGSRQ